MSVGMGSVLSVSQTMEKLAMMKSVKIREQLIVKVVVLLVLNVIAISIQI